jgi:hypothetical protein
MTLPDRDPARAERQIIALLEKARSTPFEAEAEAATAKAFELMARHHVDEALLEARRASDDRAGIVEQDVDLGHGPYVNARLALLVNVCEAPSVRCLTSSGPDGLIGHLIGHRSDVDRALLLHNSLHAQAAVQVVAASDAQRRGGRPSSWSSASGCDEIRADPEEASYGWGAVPVLARIGATEWETSLLPKDGGYVLPVKQAVRRAERVDEGDTVAVAPTVAPRGGRAANRSGRTTSHREAEADGMIPILSVRRRHRRISG